VSIPATGLAALAALAAFVAFLFTSVRFFVMVSQVTLSKRENRSRPDHGVGVWIGSGETGDAGDRKGGDSDNLAVTHPVTGEGFNN
jgi:hypothetical protein